MATWLWSFHCCWPKWGTGFRTYQKNNTHFLKVFLISELQIQANTYVNSIWLVKFGCVRQAGVLLAGQLQSKAGGPGSNPTLASCPFTSLLASYNSRCRCKVHAHLKETQVPILNHVSHFGPSRVSTILPESIKNCQQIWCWKMIWCWKFSFLQWMSLHIKHLAVQTD